MAAEAGGAPMARVTVKADSTLFRLPDLMIGANMEDLHYQMTGGISSQLIHGESFFEPSPTRLAQQEGRVEGFANCGGRWVVGGGVVQVSVAGRDAPHLAQDPVAVGVPERGVGARLTSAAPAALDVVEVGADLWLPAGSRGTAGLIARVHPNHSDNGWEWYGGYSVELQPAAQQVVLRRAARANQHREVAKAHCTFPTGAWTPVALRLEGGTLRVVVGGQEALAFAEPDLLPGGHFGLVARENVRFRGLWVQNAAGRRTEIALMPGRLIETPGDAVSLRWSPIRTGTAQAAFALDTEGGWHPGKPSQTISFVGGRGEVGIDNAGLKRWGIALAAGKPYEGFLRVKAARPTRVCVSLRSADGRKLYAAQTLVTAGRPGEYQRIPFTLTPSGEDANGRFAVTLAEPGTITLGYVFLQPGEWGRFRGLPIRKDLAEALIAQGIRVLRLNGGMIERPDYRWKHMQGSRDERPPYDGFYDRWCSNGYGVVEHIRFCEAAGLVPIVGLNLDETPEDVADFVAYCNAPADTPAGRRRAADGHPAPYRIRYYQVANESAVSRAYVDKFRQVAEAVWKVDPDITLVTTGKTYTFRGDEDEAKVREQLALHLELTRFVHARGRKLLWDVHAFNTSDDPGQPLREGGQTRGGIEFSRWLTRLAPELGKVPIGALEFNAGRFDFLRGLSHAAEMNATHRGGDVVVAVAMPNVSQPWEVFQTDWKAVLWTQGSIYYTQSKVWFQPAYYVDRMIARCWAPNVVACETLGPPTLDLLAAKSDDGKSLVLRVVNLSAEPARATIALEGFAPARPLAVVEELAGDLTAYNTFDQPERVRTIRRVWRHAGQMIYTFPGHSFTVVELQ